MSHSLSSNEVVGRFCTVKYKLKGWEGNDCSFFQDGLLAFTYENGGEVRTSKWNITRDLFTHLLTLDMISTHSSDKRNDKHTVLVAILLGKWARDIIMK
jgi:hypothetical protein